MTHHAVITGIGTVNSLGNTTDQFWNSLLSGESGTRLISSFNTSNNKSHIAAQVKQFPDEVVLDKKIIRRTSRFIQMALVSAKEAIENAAIEPKKELSAFGCLIGTGAGGHDVLDKEYAKYSERGPSGASPFGITSIIPNMASSYVAIDNGLHGPCFSPVAACASGSVAIILGSQMIESGQVIGAIAGGAESTITPFVLGGYEAMRALSTRNDTPSSASRPFDVTRDGFVIGEGAGSVVLESIEQSTARGVKVLAVISGHAMSCDAYHVSAPSETGDEIVNCMLTAISSANLHPQDISYILAHGTGTSLNDRSEARAFRKVFAGDGKAPPVSAIKASLGHTLGASGAIATVAAVCSLRDQVIPPTININEIDPDFGPIDLVTEVGGRPAKIEHVLVNSFGFGGHNSSIVVSRYIE